MTGNPARHDQYPLLKRLKLWIPLYVLVAKVAMQPTEESVAHPHPPKSREALHHVVSARRKPRAQQKRFDLPTASPPKEPHATTDRLGSGRRHPRELTTTAPAACRAESSETLWPSSADFSQQWLKLAGFC